MNKFKRSKMDNTTRDALIENDKKLYGLYETNRIDCDCYVKIFLTDSRYNEWIEIVYKDNSKHTLMEI